VEDAAVLEKVQVPPCVPLGVVGFARDTVIVNEKAPGWKVQFNVQLPYFFVELFEFDGLYLPRSNVAQGYRKELFAVHIFFPKAILPTGNHKEPVFLCPRNFAVHHS
jgi:hypothetical protein